MIPRSLPARIALAEERAGIKRGLATLDDDELQDAIAAVRRITAAHEAGTEPAGDDLALAQRAAALYAEGVRRG